MPKIYPVMDKVEKLEDELNTLEDELYKKDDEIETLKSHILQIEHENKKLKESALSYERNGNIYTFHFKIDALFGLPLELRKNTVQQTFNNFLTEIDRKCGMSACNIS